MGTDIHVFIECKNDMTDNKWKCINPKFTFNSNGDGSCFDIRDYTLFSVLAGVRGYADPIKDPCGVPDDMSPELAAIYEDWKSDTHSHTWYDLIELNIYEKTCNNEEWFESYKHFMDVIHYCVEMNGIYFVNEVNKVRVVIWFDS